MLAQKPPAFCTSRDTRTQILREWARVLDHPARETLTTRLFWKPTCGNHVPALPGLDAKDHYEALALVRDDLPGLVLLDGDDDRHIRKRRSRGKGLQRLRWRRYEIESYLVHPAALERFVEKVVGPGRARQNSRIC